MHLAEFSEEHTAAEFKAVSALKSTRIDANLLTTGNFRITAYNRNNHVFGVEQQLKKSGITQQMDCWLMDADAIPSHIKRHADCDWSIYLFCHESVPPERVSAGSRGCSVCAGMPGTADCSASLSLMPYTA